MAAIADESVNAGDEREPGYRGVYDAQGRKRDDSCQLQLELPTY